MKVELSSTEVQEAVSDYLLKRNVVLQNPTLRVVKRDKADVIVAEGELDEGDFVVNGEQVHTTAPRQ